MTREGTGELLAIRWSDVNLEKRTVLIRAIEKGAKKTARARQLPVSTRLTAILEMARTDATRREADGPGAYVFGNAIGEKISSVKRVWGTAVLKASGYTPEWSAGALSATSRAQLAVIDLHFHDLRHEAGCRWLESGMPLHHIQELLGHANLSQTSTYLHAAEFGLVESMQKFDALRDSGGKPVAKEGAIDHPPLGHKTEESPEKHRLH